jgi:hypothetical protein
MCAAGANRELDFEEAKAHGFANKVRKIDIPLLQEKGKKAL